MDRTSSIRRALGIGVASALGAGMMLVGAAAPGMAASGHWNLTETHTWQWGAYPAKIVEPLSFDGSGWNIRGAYTGSQLTSVTVNEGCGTREYDWTLPPASASDGQAFASTMSAEGSCGPKYWFWDLGFDLAGIEPGATSGWNYDGRVWQPNSDTGGTQSGTVKFPVGDATAADAAGVKKVRLQVKAERWAIQYVYTWAADDTGDINIDEGDDDPAVVAPGAPTAVRIKPVSSRKAKVTWAPPSTGSPVTSFTVKARGARSGRKWSKWQSGTTTRTSITVKLKKAGSKMQVNVTASNSAGTGPASPTVTKKMPRR